MDDIALMRAALAAGRRGLGSAWPNPSVGCAIAQVGRIVGVGTTAPGGRPHAETVALGMAGGLAHGATAYVTLEPCCHHGRTRPCTKALIAAGIARVVVAAGDPDPRVDGEGLARLRAAGVVVEAGVLAGEAEHDLAGFLARVRLGRPMVTLKLASTLDGRIATGSGLSRWITGPAARREVHALRGRHDAVMVGVGTVVADDPELTCRIPGYTGRQTVRVVADSRLRMALTARLVAGAREAPSWVLHREDADPARVEALEAAGVRCLAVSGGAGEREGGRLLSNPPHARGVDIALAMRALGGAGLTAVLVEGGGRLAASLLAGELVDRIAWFHAPCVMGGDGIAAVHALGVESMAALKRFRRVASRPVGDDLLSTYSRI